MTTPLHTNYPESRVGLSLIHILQRKDVEVSRVIFLSSEPRRLGQGGCGFVPARWHKPFFRAPVFSSFPTQVEFCAADFVFYGF
jgi:hypothetical protein